MQYYICELINNSQLAFVINNSLQRSEGTVKFSKLLTDIQL